MTLIRVFWADWSNIGFVHLHALRTIDLQVITINCPFLDLCGTQMRYCATATVGACSFNFISLLTHLFLLIIHLLRRFANFARTLGPPWKASTGATLGQLSSIFLQIDLFGASVTPVYTARYFRASCEPFSSHYLPFVYRLVMASQCIINILPGPSCSLCLCLIRNFYVSLSNIKPKFVPV